MLFLILATSLSFQPQAVDALLSWKNGKVYAFSGGYYYRYDVNRNALDPGYPKTIAGNWPGLPFSRVDAAVNWQNGKAYLFSGAYYVRYDIATDRVEGSAGYISSNWNLNWNKVDAALYWRNNKVFLFNNDSGTYARYDLNSNRPDPGYPKYTAQNWPTLPFQRLGSASNYGGRGVFTLNNSFTRLDVVTNQADAGFPKPLNYLPAVAYRTAPSNPPPRVNPNPPPRTYNPPPTSQVGTCTINGTIAVIGTDQYNRSVWKPWNGLRLTLNIANTNFQPRLNQLMGAGYDHTNAMKMAMKEGHLWNRSVNSVTAAPQYVSQKYGWNYSWFGFVKLAPGYYMITVDGYPQLTRWVKFTAGGQKIKVELTYP